ncbi:Uu.00g124840.m01.CDS01 [Anthostomella pinea]|uniref:Uu.00g124840.m01.CDS01 n=1 Tax=Anthostomella pinea TaxID=933095 RepID=A0AAI8VHN2_9PEZI|nr:Uu.00g124840.m01.CDS01 [Anthostomella pinea]
MENTNTLEEEYEGLSNQVAETHISNFSKYDEVKAAENDKAGPLSFGLEFEFLVAYVDGDVDDPFIEMVDPNPEDKRPLIGCKSSGSPYDGNIIRKVASALSKVASAPVRLCEDDTFHEPHDNVPVYDAWRVGHDSSIVPGSEILNKGYRFIDCEVSSPVISTYDPTQRMQIQDIVRALRGLRVHLNESTSVHVHIGRCEEAFSLLTVKKLCTMLWFLEEQLLDLNHPSRKNSKYCYMVTKYSVLARKTLEDLQNEETGVNQNLRDLEEMDEHAPAAKAPLADVTELQRAQLRRIWGCTDLEELARLMLGNTNARETDPRAVIQRGSVGFKRFMPAGKSGGNTQTFEFRQQIGCLDADHILRWVNVCQAFTDFARRSGPLTFRDFLVNVVNQKPGEKYSAFDMLKDLGIRTTYWKAHAAALRQTKELYPGGETGGLFVPQTA